MPVPLKDSENILAHAILAETTASVSELKKNPLGTVAAGEGFPVAILNRNEPAFHCVPAKAYEALMDKLEDLELNALASVRLVLEPLTSGRSGCFLCCRYWRPRS
jgi:antitoxin StbD